MQTPFSLQQSPEPGGKLQKFCGDTVTFALTLSKPRQGTAWVRTNIGRAAITRREIIHEAEYDETPLIKDWFDIPMTRVSDHCHRLTLPLIEVGHFEGKCLFIEEGGIDPVWPGGGNTTVNVQPADLCCGNIIYNAFVRQFGNSKSRGAFDGVDKTWIQTLDAKGFTVIPPSGTFRDLIRELDFIMGELGCRIIQLLPIHPTPTTFARMGRFGSPYAALDFTSVDTALAEFDPKTTPMEQFIELVDAVHERNGKIIIDIAVNHTGWGAEIHETHPEWLVRDREGRIENPGAWGITWEDLTKLDYAHKDLWHYVAEVFLIWCKRGVDGFRCDAGYMIPLPTWTYIIAKVRTQFPDTLFLLEGLGGKISVCRELLNRANFNWAYSELFQNYDRGQIEHYLPEAIAISSQDGNLVHFAETHDNPRLAAKSDIYAKLRTALCALSSINGAFGFANGVEWLAKEKIVVHESHSLNWGAKKNLVPHLQRLHILLREHPAFHDGTELKMIQTGNGNHLVLVRRNEASGKNLLIAANLDDGSPTFCQWKPQPGFDNTHLLDLLSGVKFTIQHARDHHGCWLEAGQVLCLTPDADDLPLIGAFKRNLLSLPSRIQHQRYRLKVLEILPGFTQGPDFDAAAFKDAVKRFAEDPEEFIRSVNPDPDHFSPSPRITYWDWPRDMHRAVMVPAGHFLMIRSNTHFSAWIETQTRVLRKEPCFLRKDQSFFAIFSPLAPVTKTMACTLKITVHQQPNALHGSGNLLFLPHVASDTSVQRSFSRAAIHAHPLVLLQTNGRGGMLHTPVSWGKLSSRYDALLAANLNPDFPEDRWIMFTRCRAWIVFQGYSYELAQICLDHFAVDEDGSGIWLFHVPVGRGKHIALTVKIQMDQGKNTTHLVFQRHNMEDQADRLDDEIPVRLILRPDIEDRSFHETTKAYAGPEQEWPGAVTTKKTGFVFSPSASRILKMEIHKGAYAQAPEWYYMVYRELEAQRGLDPHSDLFSPGYFSVFLNGGEITELTALVCDTPEETIAFIHADRKNQAVASHHMPVSPVLAVLQQATSAFVVKRDAFDTVIAGYPWFLDWGRDTLIVTRGLIAAGQMDRVQSILTQFAKFESKGTLPNMIRGENADNRDTSDAPLWFCVSCADLMAAQGHMDFLNASCGNRTIREVLLSIGSAYADGTPNGIAMDPDSGLIFSPAHFTWMDTNHPAGSPREGYPIEIQALWYATVSLLQKVEAPKRASSWKKRGNKIQTSILNLYRINGMPYLSDCLHALPGQSAQSAQADDALRPNQLLAITLGAVCDPITCKNILTACQSLLVPGAIRSLADQEVKHPLAVYHHGRLLNNPDFPYQGYYGGDEDTQRKPSYHNGTAWTWLFPSFSEAYAMVYGKGANPTALSILSSSLDVLATGCVGHIPEIMDGNDPHTPRGCDAQAWGASELYRVWKKLL